MTNYNFDQEYRPTKLEIFSDKLRDFIGRHPLASVFVTAAVAFGAGLKIDSHDVEFDLTPETAHSATYGKVTQEGMCRDLTKGFFNIQNAYRQANNHQYQLPMMGYNDENNCSNYINVIDIPTFIK